MEWIEALQKAITYMEEHQEGSELINGNKGLFLEDIARVRGSYK